MSTSKTKELILVTGGAGFIGGHLVDALIKGGYRVRVLDNLSPPTHNGKLPEWFNNKAEFYKGDVRRKKDWKRALTGVNYVFHLAAYMDFHPDFSIYFTTNAAGTALFYEVAAEEKLSIKKVIIASSQAVYGEGKYFCPKHSIIYSLLRPEEQLKKGKWEVLCPRDGKIIKPLFAKEEDQVYPINPYGISKKAAEDTILSLGRLYNIPSVALRFSIVLGPRQSFRHFYSGALRQFSVMALAGQKFTMHEDSQQFRDYIDVRDVVAAHLTVLKNPQADFHIFNVGSGRPTRVQDLARQTAKIAGVNFVSYTPGFYRIGAPRHSIMDISKLKKIGWRPQYSLEDSVREYFTWIKNYPEAQEFFVKTMQQMEQGGLLKRSSNFF